jgi:ribosomal protein S27AE
MTEHLDAICAVLEAKLDAAPAATARRLLRPQLRWVAGGAGDELAYRLGVVALVEECRDEHLAALDADDGLTVLLVEWRDIVMHACERARARDPSPRCPRCGERMLAEHLRRKTLRYRCSACRRGS